MYCSFICCCTAKSTVATMNTILSAIRVFKHHRLMQMVCTVVQWLTSWTENPGVVSPIPCPTLIILTVYTQRYHVSKYASVVRSAEILQFTIHKTILCFVTWLAASRVIAWLLGILLMLVTYSKLILTNAN